MTFFSRFLGFTPDEMKAASAKYSIPCDVNGVFEQAEFQRDAALAMPWNGVVKWTGKNHIEDAFKIHKASCMDL